jgi:hypothetical protein
MSLEPPTITLTTHEQWSDWLAVIEDRAKACEHWCYINPDAKVEPPPVKPALPSRETSKHDWAGELAYYNITKNIYDTYRNNESQFNSFVLATIATQAREQLLQSSTSTVHEKLLFLKEQYSPSQFERHEKLAFSFLDLLASTPSSSLSSVRPDGLV